MKGTGPLASGETPSQRITTHIAELGGWRGQTLARLRALILEADGAIVEEWKWGIPVWSRDGIICTGETYKQVVKLTFARGAAVADPAGLFNSSLDGNVRRAIDIREGEALDGPALKALIRGAVAVNAAARDTTAKPAKAKSAAKKTAAKNPAAKKTVARKTAAARRPR